MSDVHVLETTETSVSLAWAFDEGQNIERFTVEGSTDNVRFVTVHDHSDLTYNERVNIGGLASGVTYYFRVGAHTAEGSELSDPVSVQLPAPSSVPPAPPFSDGAFGVNGLAAVGSAYVGNLLFEQQTLSLGSVVQPDGKIVVASYDSGAVGGFGVGLTLTRWQPDGTRDFTFGFAGRSGLSHTHGDLGIPHTGVHGGNVVADGSGGYYVSIFPMNGVVRVLRCGGDGEWDTTYAGDGILETGVLGTNETTGYEARRANLTPPSNVQAQSSSLALDGEGRLIVVGSAIRTYEQASGHEAISRDFAVERYLPGGLPDPSFDGDGRATTPFPVSEDPQVSDAAAFAVTFDAQDRLVVVGRALAPQGDLGVLAMDFALARYHSSDGSLDTDFGGDGRVTTHFHAGGDPYVQGAPYPKDDRMGVIWGFHEMDMPYIGAMAQSVVIDGAGGIIVGGAEQSYLGFSEHFEYYTGTEEWPLISERFALARYLPTGSLDTGFGGGGGVVRTSPYTGGSTVGFVRDLYPDAGERHGLVRGRISGLTIDRSGRIVAGGDYWMSTYTIGSSYQPYTTVEATGAAIARYHADGTPDLTFGDRGLIDTTMGLPGVVEQRRPEPTLGQAPVVHLAGVAIAADGDVFAVADTHDVVVPSGWPYHGHARDEKILVVKYQSDPRVDPATIDSDLQSKATLLQDAGTDSVITYQAATTAEVNAFLDAVAGLAVDPAGSTVNITLEAEGESFSGQTVSVPAGVVLTINGATFVGASPSLTVAAGSVVVTNSTLLNSTDAPTVLVLPGGSLTLRGSTVQESDQHDQAAIHVEVGGSVDLGTAADPGNNTLNVNGDGVLLRNDGSASIDPALDPAAGNTFSLGGVAALGNRVLQGMGWADFNDDAAVNFGERGLAGVGASLSGIDVFGRTVSRSTQTDGDGIYAFGMLWPGRYAISKTTTPAGLVDGKDAVGSLGGGNATPNVFSDVRIGAAADGVAYNFALRPAPGAAVAAEQTAGIGFWANKHGQALISQFQDIGPWLAATLPNTFGPVAGADGDLSALTPAEVASAFVSKFLLRDKLDAQVMATALNVFATNASLGGPAAAGHGFVVSEYGLGVATWNVGTSGAAFGVADGATLTVMDLLLNWDEESVPNGGDDRLRAMARSVFGAINGL